jgi:hypothetical protein
MFQKLIFKSYDSLETEEEKKLAFLHWPRREDTTRISSAFWTIDRLSTACDAKRVTTMSKLFELGRSKSLSMGDAAVLILNSAGHDLLRSRVPARTRAPFGAWHAHDVELCFSDAHAI